MTTQKSLVCHESAGGAGAFASQLTGDARTTGLTLMLVEDSPLVRDTLRELLGEVAGLRIVGEFDHAGDAIAAIDRTPPDVVLLDIRLRASNGMQVLSHVKQNLPSVSVIVFSSKSGELDRQRFLAAGADGFFSKTNEVAQLHSALVLLAEAARNKIDKPLLRTWR